MSFNAKRRRGWNRAPGTHAKIMGPAFCHRVPEVFNGEIERAQFERRLEMYGDAILFEERNRMRRSFNKRMSTRTFRKDRERHRQQRFWHLPVDRLS